MIHRRTYPKSSSPGVLGVIALILGSLVIHLLGWAALIWIAILVIRGMGVIS